MLGSPPIRMRQNGDAEVSGWNPRVSTLHRRSRRGMSQDTQGTAGTRVLVQETSQEVQQEARVESAELVATLREQLDELRSQVTEQQAKLQAEVMELRAQVGASGTASQRRRSGVGQPAARTSSRASSRT